MITTFNIIPIGKPRMTQSDKWRKRPAVMKYWEYKERLTIQAKLLGFTVPECLEILFIIPMPKSWSAKKKAAMDGKPHQQKIDVDNAIKGFFDCLCVDDSYIYYVSAMKVWGHSGKIKVNTSGMESVADKFAQNLTM